MSLLRITFLWIFSTNDFRASLSNPMNAPVLFQPCFSRMNISNQLWRLGYKHNIILFPCLNYDNIMWRLCTFLPYINGCYNYSLYIMFPVTAVQNFKPRLLRIILKRIRLLTFLSHRFVRFFDSSNIIFSRLIIQKHFTGIWQCNLC